MYKIVDFAIDTTTKVGFGNGQNCHNSKWKCCHMSIATIFNCCF